MSVSSEVKQYYDSTVDGRVSDFINGNPRIEEAWKTVEQWAGDAPRSILEIGCGVGDVCWRMSLCWPDANIVGLDVSPKELETACTLFESEKVTFVEGPLTRNSLQGPFDLIVLMDVYEHILPADRLELHEALEELESDECRVILSFPTPRHQERLRQHEPHLIQPVDEDVSLDVIVRLAHDLDRDLLLYQDGGVWHEGDYAYAVIGRRFGWIEIPQQSFARGLRRLASNLYKRLTGRKHLTVAKRRNFRLPSRARRLSLVRRRLAPPASSSE